jgi:hypothetical protein
MKWIKVSEQLPKSSGKILLWNDPVMTMGELFAYKNGLPLWEANDGPFYPTHWMPLPNPPEE